MMAGDRYRLIPFVKSFVEDNKVQAKPLNNAKVLKGIKILKSKANKALLKKAQLDKRAELIDGCKEDFFYKFYTTDRKYRIYSRLTHKGIFVYQLSNRQTEKRLEITSVESLLSDRETLFSSKYLDYLYNHDTMVQQSKTVSMLGPNRFCVNFALNSTPNLPIKWEHPFKDTLEQLMEQAHREKKPLMIYYNKLYNFYCQIEDAEKLIALNSLIQCNQPDYETGLDPDDLITYLLYILDQCREWEEDDKKSFTESDYEEAYSNFVLNVLLNKSSQQRDILNNISEQLLERMQLEKKPAAVYDEILSGAYKEAKNKIQSAVLYKIKEWYPDTGIPANAAIYFLRNILNKCAEKERDIKGMKDLLGAGNFSPTYTAQDAQKARIYIAQEEQLRSLHGKLESWIKTHEFPFYKEMFGVQGDKCREVRIPDEMLSKVTMHLKDYIVHSRSRVRELSIDNIHKIINQLLDNQVINEQAIELEKQFPALKKQDLHKKIQDKFKGLLPFRLLVLCTIGKGGFLAGRSSLAGDSLEESLKKICSKVTPKSRYQYLSLLLNLCMDFRLNTKDAEENLLYFIRYYGILIESDEESKLWNSAIKGSALADSPVSLGFKVSA